MARLSYSKHPLNTTAAQSFGHQIKYRRLAIDRHKRILIRRLYNNKRRQIRYARRLRRLRRLAY